MKTFGITGSIAGGKSAVCTLLEQYWPVIDADMVSREVVAPGQEGLAQVVAAFGPEVLQADGNLNRAFVRNLIANDKSAQVRLNGILHPIIIATIAGRVQELAKAGHEFVFVAAALMLETGSYKKYDGVIVVSAPAAERLQRLLARDGMDETSARNLMAKQMPDEEKRTYATVEIVNDGSLEDLEQRTWQAMTKLDIHRPKSDE